MKKIVTIFMILAVACVLLPNMQARAATYWVSNNGTVAWSACRSDTPLSGASCCNLATANANAAAGDTVYFRGGTYSVNSIYGAAINPSHSGTCASPPCTGGVGANRIEFAAYAGETPVITQANTTNIMMGISLNGKSWIKVTGITFKKFTYYLAFIRAGSSYNEISNCSFVADAGYETGLGFIVGGFDGLSGWSVHNWIHHNYFSKKQNSNPCGEAIDMIRLGNEETNPWSADNNNTFESNYTEYAGHATLVTNSLNNVIKSNIFHNEPFIAGCTNWQASTSASSVSIGTGSKSFITQTNVAGYTTGQPIAIIAVSDYSQAMNGTVTSYTSGTGALVVNITHSTGSGTYNSWILSQGNIPYYENASYNGLYGHRNIGLGDENHFVDNHNLAEGNRLGFASTNPGNAGSSNLDFESPGNIGRYNFVYGGMDSGIYFKWANTPTWGNGTGGVRNYVYNNTVYHNGHGWNPAVYGGKSLAYNGQGIAQLNYSSTVNSDNVIKNNLVYDNSQGDICELGWYGNNNCTAKPYDTVINNWLTTNGDPKFINTDLTDPTSQNLFPSVHGYAATPIPDLGLQASSPAINGGAYLTQANGAGANSTTLVVDDVGYFQDGTWGSDLARGVTLFADWIAIGTVANAVQISSINYDTNTISLASPMTWSDGANIWLYKDSSGRRVLYGNAPDIGAYEYVPGIALNSPTGGETWVRGFSHDIKWSSSGVTEPVKIELFKASTLQWDVTVSFGSGTSEWQIPTNQAVGSDYAIKISAGAYEDTSAAFSIAAPAAPDVNTLEAQSVTTSSALLRGTVNPMGSGTTYYFQYGPTDVYVSETVKVTLAAGDVETAVHAAISGLNASTTYHFRLQATNAFGTSYGDDHTFTTSSNGGGGDDSGGGGGGGGGGCFIKTAQSHGKTGSWLETWGVWLLCMALWLGLSLRKNLALSRVFQEKGIRRIGYKKNKYIFSVLLVSYFLFSIPVYADVIKAKSCSQQDVQAAIDAAGDGDTVLVPEGTATWTTPVFAKPAVQIGKQTDWNPDTFESKQITLQGAGIDKTIVIDGADHTYHESAIQVFTVPGKYVRITGFTIRRTGLKAEGGSINIGGTGSTWRIDHIKITDAESGNGITAWGDSYGVIEHCDFITVGINPNAKQNFKCFQIVGNGDASWKKPLSLGTADAVYIEDCMSDHKFAYCTLDGAEGARWVFRYNIVYNDSSIGTHGHDTGNRSNISYEIYNNLFIHNIKGYYYNASGSRGGTGVVFNNTVNSILGGWNSFHTLYYYCADPDNPGDCSCKTCKICTSYPCQDQPGFGPDSNNDGEQDSEPVYEWDNTLTPDITPHIQVYKGHPSDRAPEFIQENRDYYINTRRPGYMPYSYPHPLTQVKRLSVTSPNGRESWVVGTSMTVTWLQDNLDGNLTIDLYKGGIFQRNMGATPAVAGMFSWTIPAQLMPADDYKVKIYQEGLEDESDEAFSITSTCEPPQITDQPQSQNINLGQIAGLWVGASGSYALHYQWYQGQSGDTSTPLGKDLSSFSTSQFLTETTQYWVRVRNDCGSVDSQIATINIQGGGGSGTSAEGGGGGGGGCFITAARSQGLTGSLWESWETVLIFMVLLLGIGLGPKALSIKMNKILMRVGLMAAILLCVCLAAQAGVL
jgi:hypothetical protein